MADTTQGKPAFEHLRVFHDAARALTSSLDLPSILRSILEQMERYFRPESWSLLMVDEQQHDLYFVLSRGHSDETLHSIRIPLGSGMPGWVALHGEPLITADDSRAAPLIDFAQPHSTICLPLRARERTLGVLQISHVEPLALSEEAITFLYILCDYAAIAIDNARAVARIQELTITDDVTELYNARHLTASLPIELERAKRFGSEVSVIFLDIDHFKRVNDEHGHAIGTRALAEVAEVIRKTMRNVDVCFRYGGDEFVVVLPQTSPTAGIKAASRLLAALRARRFLSAEAISLRLSASLGVASYPQDAATATELLDCADRRMYRVKNSTRDDIATRG